MEAQTIDGTGLENQSSDDVVQNLIRSFVALACTIMVFPQLDALGQEDFERAVSYLVESLQGDLYRLEPVEEEATQGSDKSKAGLKIYVEAHVDSTIGSLDNDDTVSIKEFLFAELLRKYRGTHHGDWLATFSKASVAR